MEPYAVIQASILIQPHRTVIATRGTSGFRGTPVEKHCYTLLKLVCDLKHISCNYFHNSVKDDFTF